jgi:hypothetical protein
VTVFKRKIFYVGGFDPRGVRHYHSMYHEAAARWSERTGKPLAVSSRRNLSPTRTDWTVDNPAEAAETSYSFLRWEDLVRRAWIKNPVALGLRAARTYGGLIGRFDTKMARRVPSGPIKTLFYPPVFSVALPLLLGLIPFLLALIWLPWWAALVIGAVLGIAAATPILKKLHTPWLLRFFTFNAETGGGEADPVMAERLDTFATDILAELDGDWDEVLLVTHSNGSILAVPLMERLLAARGNAMPANFALITFGQSIPLILCRGDAGRFKQQLAHVGQGAFRWFDIGSPPDGAGFHGVNPMALIGAETRPTLIHLNPRFYKFYNPDTYHSGLANKYEIHFDYLRVGDRVSPLDYPSITASAQPIEASVAAFQALE